MSIIPIPQPPQIQLTVPSTHGSMHVTRIWDKVYRVETVNPDGKVLMVSLYDIQHSMLIELDNSREIMRWIVTYTSLTADGFCRMFGGIHVIHIDDLCEHGFLDIVISDTHSIEFDLMDADTYYGIYDNPTYGRLDFIEIRETKGTTITSNVLRYDHETQTIYGKLDDGLIGWRHYVKVNDVEWDCPLRK